MLLKYKRIIVCVRLILSGKGKQLCSSNALFYSSARCHSDWSLAHILVYPRVIWNYFNRILCGKMIVINIIVTNAPAKRSTAAYSLGFHYMRLDLRAPDAIGDLCVTVF